MTAPGAPPFRLALAKGGKDKPQILRLGLKSSLRMTNQRDLLTRRALPPDTLIPPQLMHL